MVEAKVFLEVLMRLFADPSGLVGGGERFEAGAGWQVRGVVFAFSGRTAFADPPNLLVTRNGLHTAICHAMPVAIGDTDTGCGELAIQTAFGPSPPADLPPFLVPRHLFGGNGNAIGEVIFAAPTAPGLGKDQADICRIDVLAPRQADRPGEAARSEPGEKARSIRNPHRPAHSRNPTATGTSPEASVTETSDWQFAVLRNDEAYCGATPTERSPFVGRQVSSITTKASSLPTSLSAPSRAAIGCTLLRSPRPSSLATQVGHIRPLVLCPPAPQ
jgi:hypothetical protein